MGWGHSHLHKFFQGTVYERRKFLTDYDLSEGYEGISEFEVRVDQVLHKVGDKLRYEYDFGDGWDHTIEVEKVLPETLSAPRCIGGRRACPPEDCGGVPRVPSTPSTWIRRNWRSGSPRPGTRTTSTRRRSMSFWTYVASNRRGRL